jgi:hypothetical protein
MDDRDLEARLRAHLHRRFDDAQPSGELVAAVGQALASRPVSTGLYNLRMPRQLGWQVVVAAAVIVAIAVAGARFGGLLRPAGPFATASIPVTPTPAPERDFIVMPPTAAIPSKPDSILASNILLKRLQTLGFQVITSGGGYAIQFRVPAEGPSDDVVRAVLAATGDLRVVPLPPEDYGDGKLTAEIGEPLPKDEPALFAWAGIAAVALDVDQQSRPALTITLKEAVKEAFADYTTAHVGETFAIVVDDRVALLPIVNEPIVGGQLVLSAGDLDSGWQIASAILVGGRLPEAWADPDVPVVLSRGQAVAAAFRQVPGTMVDAADLDAIQDSSTYGWRAVWRITLEGETVVSVDATTGAWLSTGIP